MKDKKNKKEKIPKLFAVVVNDEVDNLFDDMKDAVLHAEELTESFQADAIVYEMTPKVRFKYGIVREEH